MSTQVGQVYPIISDKSGAPLDNGLIYIGEAGQNAELYPIQIYYDEDFTIPAPQPLRTVNGYFSKNGSTAKIFIKAVECSIIVKDKFKILQWLDLNYSGILSGKGIKASDVVDESGLTQQVVNNGLNSIAEMLLIQDPKDGNRVFVNSLNGDYFSYDSSKSSINDGWFTFNGWVRQANKKIKKPRYFDCKGDGVDDSSNMANCLVALEDGDTLELEPSAIYHNLCVNGYSDNWVLSKNKITVIGNGAWFSRRKTSISTATIDANLAALQVTGDNITFNGRVNLTGNEDYFDIVDGSGTAIATGNYVRGYSSSHGLYLREANNFCAKDIYSEKAVFNVFADLCDNLTVHGRGVSSGQRYPLIGGDLGLGSAIKTAYCTNINVHFDSEYAGYCGVEVEPECKGGIVKSTSNNPAYFSVLVNSRSSDIDVTAIAIGGKNGAGLYVGNGCKSITGTFVSDSCKFGILIEPSATIATEEGDVSQVFVNGVSRNCTNESLKLIDNTSGGKLRESEIDIKSHNDGVTTSNPALTIVNNEDCQFNIGVNTAYRLLDCDKSTNSVINILYSKNITSTPMFVTQNNTIDLFVKIGGVSYQLYNADGLTVGSSKVTSAQAIPISNLFSVDIRADQLLVPTLPTSSASTVDGGIWYDGGAARVLKKK